MTTSKKAKAAIPEPTHECCMCGDYGFPNELFQCKVCQFRFQHRYCSNLYPTAGSYRVCNWCLSKDDRKGKPQNSSNSSSSHHQTKSQDDTKRKKKLKVQRGTSSKLQPSVSIRKQRSPEGPPSTRKRTLADDGVVEKLQRTKSEVARKTKSSDEISRSNNNGVTTKVLRNRVRRYKLLDEVSC